MADTIFNTVDKDALLPNEEKLLDKSSIVCNKKSNKYKDVESDHNNHSNLIAPKGGNTLEKKALLPNEIKLLVGSSNVFNKLNESATNYIKHEDDESCHNNTKNTTTYNVVEREELMPNVDNLLDKNSIVYNKLLEDITNHNNPENTDSCNSNKKYCIIPKEDPVHNDSSTYSSLLRQLSFSTLVCLSGAIMGSYLAFPAVALTEEGSGGDGIQLSQQHRQWFVSAPLLVCIPGCLIAGVVVEALGIRRTLAGCWLIMAVSWTIIATTNAIPALIVTRILQGIAASVHVLVIVLYPSEIGCTKYRGLLVSLTDVMVYFGVMTTYLLPLFINLTYLPIALGVIFLVPHGIGLYISPDSPVWLVRQNRLDEAKKSLIRLRGCKDSVDQELLDIKKAVEEGKNISTGVFEQLLLIKNPSVWKPMVLCTLLVLMKELTGQFAVTSYTVSMFRMTKTTLDPYWCTAIIGIVRFLSCFLNMFLIQRMPRKVLLSGGFILSSMAMALIAVPFLAKSDVGIWYLPSWLPLVGLVMFSIVYTGCVNPTAWTVVTELIPSSIKSVGGGIISTLFSSFQFLVGHFFLDLVFLLGSGGAFFIFSLFGLLGGIMVILCFPETSGKSLAELKYNSSKENTIQA